MGKPRGGNYHWIDNHIVRATQFKGRFSSFVEQSKLIEVFPNKKRQIGYPICLLF